MRKDNNDIKHLRWPTDKTFICNLNKTCDLVIPLYDNEKGNKNLEGKAK